MWKITSVSKIKKKKIFVHPHGIWMFPGPGLNRKEEESKAVGKRGSIGIGFEAFRNDQSIKKLSREIWANRIIWCIMKHTEWLNR